MYTASHTLLSRSELSSRLKRVSMRCILSPEMWRRIIQRVFLSRAGVCSSSVRSVIDVRERGPSRRPGWGRERPRRDVL
eukprot:1762802-Pyramimonas_sp.AAC.2